MITIIKNDKILIASESHTVISDYLNYIVNSKTKLIADPIIKKDLKGALDYKLKCLVVLEDYKELLNLYITVKHNDHKGVVSGYTFKDYIVRNY